MYYLVFAHYIHLIIYKTVIGVLFDDMVSFPELGMHARYKSLAIMKAQRTETIQILIP